MSEVFGNSGRNTWLATEAAALTTLHVSTLLDGFTARPTVYEAGDVEELNGMSYSEATAQGYPHSLLQANAIGMSLATQLGENTILESLLGNEQTKHFNQFTFMGNPHEVQKEYIGTYFSFAGRLLKGYTELLIDNSLSINDIAGILQTQFIRNRITEALATANVFWGIAALESLPDMKVKEQELGQRLRVPSLYRLTSEHEGRWPVMAYKSEVLIAARKFLEGSNADPDNQRSVGCPMRFNKVPLSVNPGDFGYLSEEQATAISQGDNPVGQFSNEKLVLIRKPIDELTKLFADFLRGTTPEL